MMTNIIREDVYTICDVCGKVHDEEGNLVNEPKIGGYNVVYEVCWDCKG